MPAFDPQIGQQYLTFLLDQRRFEEAASLAPWLLQVISILLQIGRQASWNVSVVTAYVVAAGRKRVVG